VKLGHPLGPVRVIRDALQLLSVEHVLVLEVPVDKKRA
jgi:hypothetical protein